MMIYITMLAMLTLLSNFSKKGVFFAAGVFLHS